MSDKLPDRVLNYVRSQPWAITEDGLDLILGIVERHGDPSALLTKEGDVVDDDLPTLRVRDGIGVVSINGPIVRYASMFSEISGATSLESFTKEFMRAVNDPAIKAIVLEVDSPGGELNGTEEAAQIVAMARGTKPILAHVTGLGASAAYWLASAAHMITASRTAMVGSIGVIATFVERETPEGVRVLKLRSEQSPDKQLDPFAKKGRERMQALLNHFGALFVGDVAKFRGVGEETVLKEFGKGDILTADEAAKVGMIDQVATFEAVIQEMVRRFGGAKTTPDDSALAAFQPMVPASAIAKLHRLAAQERHTLFARAHIEAPLDWSSGSRPDYIPTRTLGANLPEAVQTAAELIPLFGPGTSDTPNMAPSAGKPQEDRMSGKDVAPTQPAGVSAVADPPATDITADILALCEENNVGLADARKWIAEGKTVSDVQGEIITRLRSRPKEPTASAPVVTGVQDREELKPFESFGDQLFAVMVAGMPDGAVDPRLRSLQAAASGMNESVPQEGGFLVQTDFATTIQKRVYDVGQILSRVNVIPISANSNSYKVNAVDETSRASGSRYGGVTTQWLDEAETRTGTKPKLHPIELKLRKLGALVYLTEEQQQDAPATSALINQVVPEELNFVIEDAFIRGGGATKPVGVLNSGCLVTVAKEGSQAADTVVVQNIVKMWARLWARSRTNAVWLINQDIEPQLHTMTLAVGSGGSVVYMPAGGVSGSPFSTLFGRPVIPVEYCSTLGDLGDIILCDWSQYLAIDKGGVRQTSSIHVRFLNDELAFKFTYRIDGQPGWKTALTPYQGSNTQSPFVTLAARA